MIFFFLTQCSKQVFISYSHYLIIDGVLRDILPYCSLSSSLWGLATWNIHCLDHAGHSEGEKKNPGEAFISY